MTSGYYVLVEPWAIYVKTEEFFLEQHGDTEPWGKEWSRVEADSVDDARALGGRVKTVRERLEGETMDAQPEGDKIFYRTANHSAARRTLVDLAVGVSPIRSVSTTRREHDAGDIHYQLFAEIHRRNVGDDAAIVYTTRPDAEFVAACLAFAPKLAALLGCQRPTATTTTAKKLIDRVGSYACGQIDGEVMRRAMDPADAASAYRALADALLDRAASIDREVGKAAGTPADADS